MITMEGAQDGMILIGCFAALIVMLISGAFKSAITPRYRNPPSSHPPYPPHW